MALKRHAPEASYDSLYEDQHGSGSGPVAPAGPQDAAPYADHGTYPGYGDCGDDGGAAFAAPHGHQGAYDFHGTGTYGGQGLHGAADAGSGHAGAWDTWGTGQYDTAQFGQFDTGQFGTGQSDTGAFGQFGTGQFDTAQFETPVSATACTSGAGLTSGSGLGHSGDLGDAAPAEPHFAPAYGPAQEDGFTEWNPTEDSLRPVRGRHRVAKQRGGMARSSAVLGVGMIAAVGAGGMASAKDKSPTAISMPDLPSLADAVADELPGDLPGMGGGAAGDSGDTAAPAQAPLTQAGFSGTGDPSQSGDAGEALRARILAQAAQQQNDADQTARQQATEAAADKAAEEAAAAAAKAEAERKAEEERKRREAARKAEQERLERLARSYSLPLSSYTLTSGYGAAGGMWENNHTGQDFAAQTGTPVLAVHSGTVKEAGWAGSYGYRIVLELEDGTEIWYCHLSSMNVSAGAEVTTKDVIGNVGSTGNSTGPHLHLEVRPGGGDPVDPLAWLRGKGLGV